MTRSTAGYCRIHMRCCPIHEGVNVRTPHGGVGLVVGRTALGSWLVRFPITGVVFPWHDSQLTITEKETN